MRVQIVKCLVTDLTQANNTIYVLIINKINELSRIRKNSAKATKQVAPTTEVIKIDLSDVDFGLYSEVPAELQTFSLTTDKKKHFSFKWVKRLIRLVEKRDK